jgi:phosphatidylserine/phosphatidylglycerophosphate/cardiolipin synthase-like enzyme
MRTMPQEIIDNHRVRLVDRVGDLLQAGATRARFAVGYLFLDGLITLRSQISRLDEICFLIGNVVNRLPDEQIREVTDSRARGGEDLVLDQADVASTLRLQHDRLAVETALNLRETIANVPRTAETRALLLTLAGRIADGGLKVRLYPHGRIHAKASIIRYSEGHPDAPGVAIVGSSNLTLASRPQPTEMNVVIRTPDAVDELERWYVGIWNQGQDFNRELFDELGRSWALE